MSEPNEKARRCPDCGGKAHVLQGTKDYDGRKRPAWWVRCRFKECRHIGPFWDRYDAVLRWNRMEAVK